MTNLNNLESKLSELWKEPFKELLKTNSNSKENLCQSGQTCDLRTLYSGKITYDSTAISSKLLDIPEYSDQNIESKNISSNLA